MHVYRLCPSWPALAVLAATWWNTVAWSQDLVAPTEPLSAQEQLQKFHLPEGFEIQLVAAEPDIRKPINLAFDGQGRLYATQSVEYPFPAEGDDPPRDVLKVFSDIGADGSAGKAWTYIDGLNIPIGVVAIDGGVLLYSIPNIWFCPDESEDGTADRREVFYGTFGFVDTHGMGSSFRHWIDGWIYGCHGFANHSELSGADGESIKLHSGNTYRMRPDGSRIEYFTHGQTNPFGLTFDPLGNLYSSDCHTLPVYMLLRGAWYPSFGKPHDGLGFGPTMLEHLHGSTGIAGIAYYADDHFPEEYRDTIFIGNPVTGRVNHDRLEVHGSTYRAIEMPDFVRCDDPWFRPVDVQMGPDGALYIADFYNRIIGHYEVPLNHPGRDRERGRIWRVVYRGTGGEAPLPRPVPNLKAVDDVDELIALLADENLQLRTLATHEISARWDSLQPESRLRKLMSPSSDPAQRVHALWLLERHAGLDDALIEQLAGDPERLVRVHLIKALAERPVWTSSPLDLRALVVGKLQDPDAFVRRAAADALGRHPSVENLRPLLDLWITTPGDDTHLVHVARMALRDQLLLPEMYGAVAALLESAPRYGMYIADVSLGVHDGRAAAFLLEHLQGNSFDRNRLGQFLHHATRHADGERLTEVYAYGMSYQSAERAEQLTVVRALHQATQERPGKLPDEVREWSMALAQSLLEDESRDRVHEGILLAREMKLRRVHDAVAAVGARDSRFADLRSAALDAGVAIDAGGSVPLLSEILGDATEPLDLRQKAASLLANINDEGARDQLLAQLPVAPERLAVEIAAALAASRPGAEALLNAIETGKASARLLQERNVEGRLRAVDLPDLDARLQTLTEGLPAADERIAALIAQRRDGFLQAEPDLNRGQEVFQKTCAACHRLEGKGAKIGPELDGVGQRGLDRVLEDVLDPSRNVDQAFRSTIVATTSGQVLTGLVLREEGNVLVMADAEGKEIRVPLDEIDEREVSLLSPMPGNVPDIVAEDDFYHLIGYLLSQRQQAAEGE